MFTAILCAAALGTAATVEDLPLIDPGVTVSQASSHNKQGLNGDGGFWIYTEKGDEPGLVGWSVVDEGAAPELSLERAHSGRAALCHRVERKGRESGWRSVVKTLSADLNVADCDAVTLWVWPTYADGGIDYGIRIDSGGAATELPIRDLKAGEWNEVTVDISQVPREGVSQFWLLFHVDWGCDERNAFYVDEIAFRRPDGSTIPVDDFESGLQWRVVLDALGPGCVRNMWGLGGGRMRIEADGETVVEATQDDLFDGKTPQFEPPLVSRKCVSTGPWLAEAHWSFVPVPFEKRCRILTDTPFPFNHYIIERYRDPALAARERAAEDEQRYREDWARIGEDPKPWAYPGKAGGDRTLRTGERVELASVAGAGAIGMLKLRIDPTSDAVLNDARLRMYWDGEEQPSVDAPLGIFFGCGVSWKPVPSLLIGTRGNEGYCYFPMPFWKSARVEVVNGSAELLRLGWQIAWTNRPYPEERTGYFRTWFHHDPATPLGRDYLFLETEGQGQFVGVVHTLVGGHYCEGDIRFYIDGSRTPRLYGTGSEDYYHAACWPNADYHTPFHGCVGDIAAEAKERGVSFYDIRACYYRFHLEAPVRFQNGVRCGIEHGGTNDTISDYTSLAFYYQEDAPGLVRSDQVTIGDEADEAAHGLECPGAERGALAGFFEGDFDDVECTFATLSTREPVRVTLAIDPANAGVRLRRVLDQLAGRQWAEVFVDGQKAGDWYDADENQFKRLAESEFEIPRELTAGKGRIEVEFRPRTDGPAWSLLELAAWGYVEP